MTTRSTPCLRHSTRPSLFVGILIAVCGQLLLKSGVQATSDFAAQLLNVYTIMGVGFYGCAAFLYLIAIRKIPISVAYPSVAMSYVVVAVVAHFAWDESLTAGKIGAIAMILAGVALLHRL